MGSHPSTRTRPTTSTSNGEAGRIDRPPAPPSPDPAALWVLVELWEQIGEPADGDDDFTLGRCSGLQSAALRLREALLPPEAP